jgi:hypothetical protein
MNASASRGSASDAEQQTFIFADLIVIPILNIYRKYYGLKMAGFLFVTFYIAMAAAALIVDLIFGALALIPPEHKAQVVEASITWNYTSWLNLAFLVLAGILIWRFLKTGGPAMLRDSHLALPQDRRTSDVAHDEQASQPRTRSPACSLEGRSDSSAHRVKENTP